jgi:sulfur-oxidizing protein SoxX
MSLLLALALNAASAFAMVGDGMPQPLTDTAGDAARGRAIVVNRQIGSCLLCHSGPFERTAEERVQGNLAGSLGGVGGRLNAAQLRLRIADARRLNPEGLMPSFHRRDDPPRVGRAWQGRPILDAQQVEDVVTFLQTLR